MISFIIATDGGTYRTQPGPGNYGYIIQGYEGKRLVCEKTAAYALETETTSNRMELTAILYAIYAVDDEMELTGDECSDKVRLISDSLNAVNWLTGRFQINDAIIRAYVSDIHRAIEDAGIEVEFQHVQGHSKVHADMTVAQRLNCRVDQMLRDIRKVD